VKLWFTEEMKGFISPGEVEYEAAFREGRGAGRSLAFHLTIATDDVGSFVTHPEHEARAEGTIRCEALGGERPVEAGTFNLLVDQADPARKLMLYRLYFRDGEGRPLTLSGLKDVKEDPRLDLWTATTTLFTRILRGHVSAEAEAGAEVVAAGIVHVFLLDFLKQLTTFRTEGPSVSARALGLGRFTRLFLGKLWDVYGRDILTSGPV
jgi:cholesterol oxidase